MKQNFASKFINYLLEQGDNRNIDMTVNDIYGGSLSNMIPKDIIASSLGKAGKCNNP